MHLNNYRLTVHKLPIANYRWIMTNNGNITLTTETPHQAAYRREVLVIDADGAHVSRVCLRPGDHDDLPETPGYLTFGDTDGQPILIFRPGDGWVLLESTGDEWITSVRDRDDETRALDEACDWLRRSMRDAEQD